MMRSLFSGVSGLRNSQVRMDVIGNNIANVNTIGFKKSRVNFQDILSQTVRGAGSPQGGRGGTNPQQVGLGMSVSTIETVQTGASVQSTGKNSDLAVSGDGFFIVSDGTREFFTRDGSFNLDKNFNLVNANGMLVKGVISDANGVIDPLAASAPVNISLSSKLSMPGKASGETLFTGNLDRDSATGDTITRTATIYDSSGGAHTMTLNLTKNATTNVWDFDADISGATAGDIVGTLTFEPDGSLDPANISFTTTTDFTFPGLDNITAAGFLNLEGLTQYSSESSVTFLSTDGYSPGSLQTYSFDSTGTLTGAYSNGQRQVLAQVATATFSNPVGLEKVSENLYQSSNNSGVANRGVPGTSGRGTIIPGSLEMSNVDLSQEFSDMIVTQRGFQANSRIITVSDTMLEELINLKR